MTTKIKCNHCGGDIAIRNPSGYCDHLYYPDYCEVCQYNEKNQGGRAVVKPEVKKVLELLLKTYDKVQKIQDELRKMNFCEEILDCIGIPIDTSEYDKKEEAYYCRDWCYDILADDKLTSRQKVEKLTKDLEKT